MRSIKMEDLNQWIDEQKSKVEQIIVRNRSEEKRVRKRTRNKDEQKILDKICLARWKKAEQDGKIKYLSKRKWYYDYN